MKSEDRDETRLQVRAYAILLVIALLLAGFLLKDKLWSRVVANYAAIQLINEPDIALIDYREYPTCEKTDQFAQLERLFKRALEMDPQNWAAWQDLIKVTWARGGCSEVGQMIASLPTSRAEREPFLALISALADIRLDLFKGRANYPQPADLAKLLDLTGEQAEDQGLVDVAAQWYQAGYLLDPTLQTATWLVDYARSSGDAEPVKGVWEYLAREKPGTDDGWWAVFHQAELASDSDGMIAALKAGADSSAEPYPFLIELGWVYRQEKQYAEALIAYQRAEKLNSEVVWPVISQGQVYLDIGDLEKAEERLKLAQSIDPSNPFAYFYLGVAYDRMGDDEAAITQVRTAIDLAFQSGVNPWTISEVLGQIYIKAGQCEDAKAAYEQALEWQPAEPRLIEALQNIASCSN